MNNKINIMSHFELLGAVARNKITNKTGVITNISFDISGCLQIFMLYDEDNDTLENGEWVDLVVIETKSKKIQERPFFDTQGVKQKIKCLGKKARDIITNTSGVITSVSFSIIGVHDFLLTYQLKNKNTRKEWVSFFRIEVKPGKSVIEPPDFMNETQENVTERTVRGAKGAIDKPSP